ncbi:MAG: CvpA family protein [Planctomycetes bacterium]|nr:CvpA family protein [Planctomycetota bacterium]
MICNLAIVVVMIGFAVYMITSSTFARAFVSIIFTIIAGVIAMNFCESLSGLLIGREIIPDKALAASFLVIFVVAIALMETGMGYLLPKSLEFGHIPEMIGRGVCGLVMGLLAAGFILMALVVAPLGAKYPYQRFDRNNPQIDSPDKPLFNPDGFAVGWMKVLSNGSLSGKTNFATVHADFLTQMYLNRLERKVPLMTEGQGISVPREKGVWLGPEGLKNLDDPNQSVRASSGARLMIVRMGINSSAWSTASKFTLGQVPVTCTNGKARIIYPDGFVHSADSVRMPSLTEAINIEREGLKDNVKWIDLVVSVPNGYTPRYVGFKQNNIAALSEPVLADEAPGLSPITGGGQADSEPKESGENGEEE